MFSTGDTDRSLTPEESHYLVLGPHGARPAPSRALDPALRVPLDALGIRFGILLGLGDAVIATGKHICRSCSVEVVRLSEDLVAEALRKVKQTLVAALGIESHALMGAKQAQNAKILAELGSEYFIKDGVFNTINPEQVQEVEAPGRSPSFGHIVLSTFALPPRASDRLMLAQVLSGARSAGAGAIFLFELDPETRRAELIQHWDLGYGCSACGTSSEVEPAFGSMPLSQVGSITVRRFSTMLEELGKQPTALGAYAVRALKTVSILSDHGFADHGLGHPVSQLSTGELVRLKLALLVAERFSGCAIDLGATRQLFVPDERERLTKYVQRLRESGNLVNEWRDTSVVAVDERRRPAVPASLGWIDLQVRNAAPLHKVDLRFPSEALTVVRGPSGSGKSRLVLDLLPTVLRGKRSDFVSLRAAVPPRFAKVSTVSIEDDVAAANHSVAREAGIGDLLAKFFAGLTESRMFGLTEKDFLGHSSTFRCYDCDGFGFRVLPTGRSVCECCAGVGVRGAPLAPVFRERSFFEYAEMTATELGAAFSFARDLNIALRAMERVGLGQLKLNHLVRELGDSERQLLKIAKLLQIADNVQSRRPLAILLDFVLVGLSQLEQRRVLSILGDLVEARHTILLVDNQEISLAAADYVIELSSAVADSGEKCSVVVEH